MNPKTKRILMAVLFGLSAVTFLYGIYRAFVDRYQESIFLFGIAFVILAQAVFVYRLYRYPDVKEDTEKQEEIADVKVT